MKFELLSEMPNNGLTKFVFLLDNGQLVVDATYFEKDIPKSKIADVLDRNQIALLYGAVDSVLLGLDVAMAIPNDRTKHCLSVQFNDTRSTAVRRLFNLRIENYTKGTFVQLTDRAASLCSLKLFLQQVFARLI